MIMKCSLKDIFINILFFIIIIIIIILPSEGVEFPLSLPRGSVISDSMNLQQLRASINKLQDLDSFPVSSENQLHKIVKKQMTNCDYHKRKSKRSIVVVPERLKSFDAMKGDGPPKSLWEKPQTLKPGDSPLAPAYGICLSKLAQMARNSGIRFYPAAKPKQNGLIETTENQSEDAIITITQPLKEVPKEEENQPIKEENPNPLTMQIFNNQMTGEKLRESLLKDISKMTKDDAYRNMEGAYQQCPSMTVEDKIQQYLSEDKLPEIGLQAGETENKIKENQLRNKLFKPSNDKGEEKETKEKKDSGIDDEKKLKDQSVNEQFQEVDDKILRDLKVLENMFDEENLQTKEKANPSIKSKLKRFPDSSDSRFYYEDESKLKHKRCPQGQFFSFKFLKCLKGDNKEKCKSKFTISKRQTYFDAFSTNPEPANKWLDASQDSVTGVPSEFQSTTEPELKIYHLRPKRKYKETSEMAENVSPEFKHTPKISNEAPKIHEKSELTHDGIDGKQNRKHHAPRSYVIRIKKKEGKDQITENNDNEVDNDEDDQDSDDYDEDEEVDDEEDESDEEETSDDATEKSDGSGQSLRDLFKAAKTAVTNRARFEDPTITMAMERMNQNAGKKESTESENQNKKVLIDANIKVDSTIGSVLKSLMKTKRKESLSSLTGDEASLISDRGSQDQMDPELLRMYEHLMRSNPRVKRYFLANRHKKGK